MVPCAWAAEPGTPDSHIAHLQIYSRDHGSLLMYHVEMPKSLRTSPRLTDDGLAHLGTLGIVTASLMAILIFML